MRSRRHPGDLAALAPAVDGRHRHLVSLVEAAGQRMQGHKGVAIDMDAGGRQPRGAPFMAEGIAAKTSC